MNIHTFENKKCYEIDEIHLEEGLLDTIVDAVYVLLLENSHRSDSVYKQLNKYKLCRNVFVFINKGYKRCQKDLCQQKPAFDLMDANAQVMYHSQEKGYNNILILEDDFLLDERIRDQVILREIEEFVNTREFNVYNLGVIGIPSNPWATHMQMFATGANQAVIYSPNGKQTILHEYEKDPCLNSPWISTWFTDFRGHDLWYNRFLDKHYSYKIPLCYQIFPDTENKKDWNTSIGDLCISLLKLNTQPQPGWDNLYMALKIVSYILYVVIILLVYYLCNYLYKNLYKKLYKKS